MAYSLQSDPAAYLMQSIARYGQWKRFDVAMVWAYFDETVHEVVEGSRGKRASEMIVGGCIASQPQWDKFTLAWRRALKKAKVPLFHAKDFYEFRRDFAWHKKDGTRDYDKHNAFRDQLSDLITEHVDEAIAFTSQIEVTKKGLKHAYTQAVVDALHDCTKGRATRHTPVYVVFARHPEVSPWTILKTFEQMDWEERLAGCGVFSPRDVVPLQAADFVLSAVNKRWGGVKSESYKRLTRGFKTRSKDFTTFLATSRPRLREGHRRGG